MVTEHGFLMYKLMCAGRGCRTPGSVPDLERNRRTDVAALMAAANDNTKLVFIANPNNPTATTLS